MLDLTESNIKLGGISSSNSIGSTSTSLLTFSTNKNQPINIHVLRLQNVTQSRNFTCQAQNSFGLVVYNLSLVIKGNFFIIYLNIYINIV